MWQKIKNVYHLLVAIGANYWFGFPGKHLTVIGVTGTDGKTTTVNLIYHILKTAGLPVSMISTVGAVIHGQTSDIGFHVTNPSSFPLQKFLSKAAQKKDSYLVLEVTSHGLDQNRVWGIPFAVGVLTNITHEHLDYHKTYDNYVRAKVKLLNRAKTAIINRDDMSYTHVTKYLKGNNEIIEYALHHTAPLTDKTVRLPGHTATYNKYNMLAAVGAARKIGVPEKTIEKALSTFVFPKGRTELVYAKDFSIMVDFAHTPNAFKELLGSIRPRVRGRLIHVFGSAGKRDESKRPLMGQESAAFADVMILTSEDPRSEDPKKIMDEIAKGITKKRAEVLRIVDRKEAIAQAVKMAKKGDFIVITGKGHEKSMNYGKGEEVWDEFTAVSEALQKVHKVLSL